MAGIVVDVVVVGVAVVVDAVPEQAAANNATTAIAVSPLCSAPMAGLLVLLRTGPFAPVGPVNHPGVGEPSLVLDDQAVRRAP